MSSRFHVWSRLKSLRRKEDTELVWIARADLAFIRAGRRKLPVLIVVFLSPSTACRNETLDNYRTTIKYAM